MVGGSGKVWNPSRSSEIAYAEFSLPRYFVMPFINSYFIMIFESMLFLGCGGGGGGGGESYSCPTTPATLLFTNPTALHALHSLFWLSTIFS